MAVRQQSCKQRMKHSQKEGCVMLVFISYTLIFMLNFKLTTWLVAKDCQALQKVSPRKRWIHKLQPYERLRLCAACDWSLPLWQAFCSHSAFNNIVKCKGKGSGELSYMAPLGSENISAPYFKQCFFQGGEVLLPRLSQTPRLPVPRQK